MFASPPTLTTTDPDADEVAALRNRLLAEPLGPDPSAAERKPAGAQLCPTLRQLLERKRHARQSRT